MDDMKCRIVTLGMMDPASLGRSQTATKNNKTTSGFEDLFSVCFGSVW